MKILLILLMLYPTISFGKTYKSDGSIISNSGEIIKESRSVRYQKAQKAFQNGEEITDWPTVKANKNGKSYGQKNYFGHEILEVGAPLLSLEQLRIKDGNIMEAVAKNHGFENEKILNIAIISMSNETFQIDNKISEKQIQEMSDVLKDVGPLLSDVAGKLINDNDIKIDGISAGASLNEIAKSIGADVSLVTSRAIAETMVQSKAQSEKHAGGASKISPDGSATPAMDSDTGAAPRY